MTDLNDGTFNQLIKDNALVLIDFYATWCGPCLMLAPTIDKLGSKYKVGKVNIDENSDLASNYRILAIPTMIIFKDGKPAKTIVGLRSEEDLSALIESLK